MTIHSPLVINKEFLIHPDTDFQSAKPCDELNSSKKMQIKFNLIDGSNYY